MYMSTTSSFPWPDTTSTHTSMVPSIFQYKPSTLCCENLSIEKYSRINFRDTYRTSEATYDSMKEIVSVNSHMDYVYSGLVHLKKS
jgi:hypothetical protein